MIGPNTRGNGYRHAGRYAAWARVHIVTDDSPPAPVQTSAEPMQRSRHEHAALLQFCLQTSVALQLSTAQLALHHSNVVGG
jgi:hypothetical protein